MFSWRKDLFVMRIGCLQIDNFRCYDREVIIDFDNLTAFVGKNDVGKSSILEALDIFFNNSKGVTKLEKEDICNKGILNGDNEIRISVCFDSLPEYVVIDSTNKTNLSEEFLINAEGYLEIIKKYPNAGNERVYISAYHPTNPECDELLMKKDTELREIINKHNIPCSDRSKKSVMRKAIWDHFKDDLLLETVEIDVAKGEAKVIWENLQKYFPVYSLFQSDRKNSDQDSEVQDPLKEAVKQIMRNEEIVGQLDSIAREVESKLKEVSSRTMDKLREMSPEIASSLKPNIPSPSSLKWTDVFKGVTISSDDDIPLKKRGSGVRRLVLLNFFRAEAEKRCQETQSGSIIYAFEEPETSQHNQNQRMLIDAFKHLSESGNCQVIVTTHSAVIVKELNFENLRVIVSEEGKKIIEPVDPDRLPYPSLNEVNYLAFSETTEEYHDELYGYLVAENLLNEYKYGKPLIPYKKQNDKDKSVKNRDLVLSEYIRNIIHHPENTNNSYTKDQLGESIQLMRDFIKSRNRKE